MSASYDITAGARAAVRKWGCGCWARGPPCVCLQVAGTVEALQFVGDRVSRAWPGVALGRVLDEVLLRPECDLLERG
jgi:hypothetical protein